MSTDTLKEAEVLGAVAEQTVQLWPQNTFLDIESRGVLLNLMDSGEDYQRCKSLVS